MIFNLDELDDAEVIKEVGAIDWYKVNEIQAHSLGISLGLYREAGYENRLAYLAHLTNSFQTLAITVIIVAAYLFGATALTLLIGTVSMLIVSVLLSLIRRRATRSLVEAQRQALLIELRSMKNGDELNIDVDLELE